jgi:hypothetical protein
MARAAALSGSFATMATASTWYARSIDRRASVLAAWVGGAKKSCTEKLAAGTDTRSA